MKDHLKAIGIILLAVAITAGMALSDVFAAALIMVLLVLVLAAVVLGIYSLVLSCVRGEACSWGPYL